MSFKIPCGGFKLDENSFSLDENSVLSVSGVSGGVSWNDITDRPFYENITVVNEPLNITWDGNTEGRLEVDGLLYKVSDLVLTDEQLKSTICVTSNGRTFVTADMWDGFVESGLVTEDIVGVGESFTCVRKAGAVSLDRVFPETGIYIVKFGDFYTTSITTTEPIEQVYTELKKIDEKFLPKAEAVADIATAPTAEDFNTLLISLREAGYLAK